MPSVAIGPQLTSYRIPQVSKSVSYTTVLGDGGKHIFHPVADDSQRTFTIDSNANVPYQIGTVITFVNKINTVTLAVASDTLTLAGTGTTGSLILTANGIASALKITATEWLIYGTGLVVPYLTMGWYQPLSQPLRPVKAQFGQYTLPPLVRQYSNFGWHQPLSAIPSGTKAQVGYSTNTLK